MTRLRWIAVAVVVVVAITCYATMPPVARSLAMPSALPTPVRGVIHVHTKRSDGTGSVDDVAAAAARAGLKFVILTDHGDAAREPETPAYLRGVLCIDAVEISTNSGHLVALGLPKSPYPLGGEARDVAEDVARLGGMAIAAHPTSPKEGLRWTDWDTPLDGIEWLNGDSEWRDDPALTLVGALLTYPFRRPETLATLLDRPEAALQRWDALAARRRTVGIAGADAHARIALMSANDPDDNRISLHIPGYEQVFRTFAVSLANVTLSGDARADARAVIDAIRAGHLFSSINGLAGPVAMSFSASSGNARAEMGEELAPNGPLKFQVVTNAPQDATISLIRDGKAIATAMGAALEHTATEAGVYRVEMQLPNAPGRPPAPWVVSNPIYAWAQPPAGERPISAPAPTKFLAQYQDGAAPNWHVESSQRSQAAVDVVPAVGGTQLSLRYALGGTQSEGPFAALSTPVREGLADYDRLMFTARASGPMRLSVQFRVSSGERWQRTVYLDDTAREISIMFDDMRPRGTARSERPVLSAVRDLLLVIDTVNTRAGASGQLWLDEVKYAR